MTIKDPFQGEPILTSATGKSGSRQSDREFSDEWKHETLVRFLEDSESGANRWKYSHIEFEGERESACVQKVLFLNG